MDRHFSAPSGVGFDAAVSAKFDKAGRRGRLTYLRNTFLEYMSYHPETYTIRAAGKVMTDKAFLVAVCNASQYGNNAYIAPHASMTDGLLDVTVIHYGSPLTTALVGVDLLTGFIERNMLIHTFQSKRSDDRAQRPRPGPPRRRATSAWPDDRDKLLPGSTEPLHARRYRDIQTDHNAGAGIASRRALCYKADIQ